MIMSPLIAFLIVFVLLLIALIKLKVTPSVGLFAAAIIFGLMVGMPAADILSKLPAGFGNMMTSIGLLIVFAAIFSLFVTEGPVYTVINFVGNSNIALFIAMLVTGYVLHPYMPEKTVMQYIDAYADRTGNVLLIVGAGGCFASMLGATTMSTDLVAIMSATKMPVILLGFLLAFCIRAAVGSATAAMLTSIAIAGPVCLASGMSPIIAGLSVCLGANAATFPTDVTFWFPSTYNGLDTKDCLATTTIPCILSGAIGMVILVVLNAFSGVLPGMF